MDNQVLENLMTFDAEVADLEDGGDDEPEPDEDEDVPPVLLDLARPKLLQRGRVVPFGRIH
jgi:hypothetical protein